MLTQWQYSSVSMQEKKIFLRCFLVSKIRKTNNPSKPFFPTTLFIPASLILISRIQTNLIQYLHLMAVKSVKYNISRYPNLKKKKKSNLISYEKRKQSSRLVKKEKTFANSLPSLFVAHTLFLFSHFPYFHVLSTLYNYILRIQVFLFSRCVC